MDIIFLPTQAADMSTFIRSYAVLITAVLVVSVVSGVIILAQKFMQRRKVRA